VTKADGTGEPQPLDTGKIDDPDNPQWSPDGKWIAFDADQRVFVVPAAGGTPVAVGEAPDPEAGFTADAFPNWAPDGTAIIFERFRGFGEARAARATTDRGSQLIEVPFEHGVPVNASETRVVNADTQPQRPVYSPDGLKLLYAGYAQQPETPLRQLQGVFISTSLLVAGADGSNQDGFVGTTWQASLTAADWAPIPKPKPQPGPSTTPGVTVTPNTTQGGVKGETQRRCGSRRNFVIRLRPRGAKIVLARVIVNGKRVKAKPGKRWIARVDLRTLPKKRFKVDITVWTKDGKRHHEVRRYWTCTPAR
jgi:hypothetical protein